MELMAIVKLAPVILELITKAFASVHILKQFVPKKHRKMVNPVIAIISGLVGAYTTSGVEGVAAFLMVGVTAGVGAMATHKVKAIGNKIGTNK